MAAPRTLASADRGLSTERAVVWLVVLAITAAVAGSIALYGDELRDGAPDADFDVSFDGDTRTATVEHAGGDAIRDRTTTELAVVFEDAETGGTHRVTWVADGAGPSKRGADYPVTEGDGIAVDDPTVDADGDGNYHDAEATVGILLDEDDTVRVVWEGTTRSGSETVTLAETTVG